MRKNNREYNALADINVTNLVDVVLVLLIIFIIDHQKLMPLLLIGIPLQKLRMTQFILLPG